MDASVRAHASIPLNLHVAHLSSFIKPTDEFFLLSYFYRSYRFRVRRPVVKRWDQVQYVVINSNEILKVHFVAMRHNESIKFDHCSYKLAKVSEYLQMSVYIPVNVFVECAAFNDIYLSDTLVLHASVFFIFLTQACKKSQKN
ncbi:unnamed protein product, partial [Heterotrigona itama]